MSRRSKETLAVQLFPFLAVLVCTMGSLIFLLLVTTRQIRQRAVAFAAHQQSELELAAAEPVLPPSPPMFPEPDPKSESTVIVIPPQPERESKPTKVPDQSYAIALANRQREISELQSKWKQRTNILAKERERYEAALAERKRLHDSMLEQANSLKDEVGQLEIQLGKLAGEAAASSFSSTTEADRLLIEQQIAELKKRLRAAQIKETTAENDKFQIIPFDPASGTTRRPLFIECTAAGIRFLPEDILITAADLDGFTHRANPLAAGTGALINYWTAWNLKQRHPKSEPEPYVLLLVRPDGIFSYYVALRMLEPIRTAHGYELIDESTALKLPEVDLGARAACQAAIDRLLSERENISRAAVNSGAAGSVFGGSVRRAGSGIAKGAGTASGSGSGNPGDPRRPAGNSFTMNDVTGGDSNVGSRSWERIENFEGKPRRRKAGDQDNEFDGVASKPTDGNRLGGSSSNQPAEFTGSGSDEETTRSKRGTGPSRQSGTLAETQPPGPNSGLRKDDSAIANDDLRVSQGSPNASGSKRRSGTGKGTPSSDSPMGSGGWSESEPGMPIGQRPGKKKNNSKNPSGEPDDDSVAQRAPDGTGSTPGEGSDSSKLSDNNSSLRDPNGSPPSSSSQRSRKKPKRTSDSSDKQLEPEMLAGRRWGYCEPAAAIGFEHEVRVDVSADKIVIAEKYEIPVGDDDSKQETFERFATALDKYSREWGRPPQGFFWTPRLKFIVKPEANGHYEQLNAMMTRSGLPTSHEFAKNSATLEFGREAPAATKPVPKTAAGLKSGVVK